jgi:hypothetical protein
METAKRVFVLEDNPERLEFFRSFSPGCVTAMSYDDAVGALAGSRFDEVWLDYDIVGTKNGCDVAYWMATQLSRTSWPGLVLVHSWNVRGSLAIIQTLRHFGMPVEQRRYPPTTEYT